MTGEADPYGVPTGAVPRVEYQPPLRRSQVARAAVLGDPVQQAVDVHKMVSRWQATPGAVVHPELARAVGERAPTAAQLRAEPLTRLIHDAAIQQAVDDYLLMERKARAWDALVERARDWASVEVTLEELEREVHSAQPSAPAKT